MMRTFRSSLAKCACAAIMISACTLQSMASPVPESRLSTSVVERHTQRLGEEFTALGLELGAPIFMRIFKEEYALELWVWAQDQFQLFKTYAICTYSGALGPKRREGDNQAPEGFYFVNAGRMNPYSQYHLSINLGFPNRYDRSRDYTGSYLMVHGACVSIGCYAMTDPVIEEIWTIAQATLEGGSPFFRVHAFPFRMTEANMARYADHPEIAFWRNLKEGYDAFDHSHQAVDVTIRGRGIDTRYVFTLE